MYGKSYESKYEGSMVGAGFNVYAVWDYCITKNRSGIIELNPKLLAFVLDGGGEGSEAKVAEAIEFLSRPDSKSRSKDSEGRRLVKEGEYQYRMVNWAQYESIKSIVDLREYNRRKQQEYRERQRRKKMTKEERAAERNAGQPIKGELEYGAALENGASQDRLDEITTGKLPEALR